ncbi:unnamed protein product [Hydatigera taeniaeformis]|uniref:COesterase domain-containing protein n=1 Tax=Hydatigena taeniaeformis TaxID=6205 RepID=A0A0R3X9A0_HYDTA|nr:unnamed protein product [Hydatigera taeniaeformis]
MACDRVRVVEYRRLQESEEFFQYGRPHVEPPGVAVVCRRPLDKILLYLIALSLLGLCIHFVVAFFLLPTFPIPPPNASIDCATLIGSWNSDYTVLRFFGIPYSIPPLTKPDEQTLDVLREYLRVESGRPVLRWQMPRKIEGIEGCILSQHDRCSFQRSRWTCNLGRRRPVSTCSQPIPGEKVDFANPYALFQQERCLQVDISTPIYDGVLKPVIVLIAGFQFLTEPLMPPHYRYSAFKPTDEAVRDTDAVWVYLHYRLGLAGFFYNLTAPIAGDKTRYQLSIENFALHDQLLGLRWIKQHIKQFGGDPKRITVLGSGSGATSTLALLYMKGKKEELFHQNSDVQFVHSDGKPIRLVFSSMSNELEGWPGTDDSWMSQADDEQIEQFAEMLYRFKQPSSHNLQSLKHLMGVAWREDLSRKNAGVNRRTRQQFHLELLSILRFSCPQAWILSKFNTSKSNFYKILLDEPPDLVVPYAPGPRPTEKFTPSAKRFAFHALDMMILTGKRIESQGSDSKDNPRKKRFWNFKQKLKQMFKDFVHGGSIDSQCGATATGTTAEIYDSFAFRAIFSTLDPHGCRVTADEIQGFGKNKILTEICELIDWEKWISHIIVHN